MSNQDDIKQQIAELRRRLLGSHGPEELQSMRAELDALEALRRIEGQHDDDTDEEGHHHHEHST